MDYAEKQAAEDAKREEREALEAAETIEDPRWAMFAKVRAAAKSLYEKGQLWK